MKVPEAVWLREELKGPLARAIDPEAFEKSSGFGHQEFAEEDREARQAARDKATATLEHPRHDMREMWRRSGRPGGGRR